MGVKINGFEEFKNDLMELAAQTDADGQYWKDMTRSALASGGRIIERQAKHNAVTILTVDSGDIKNSIAVSKVVKHRKGGYTVKVGVQRKSGGAKYANPVEFGHGGPHGPAAPHPFIRPAFDAKKDEAYQKIRQELEILLFEKMNI